MSDTITIPQSFAVFIVIVTCVTSLSAFVNVFLLRKIIELRARMLWLEGALEVALRRLGLEAPPRPPRPRSSPASIDFGAAAARGGP